MAVDLCKQRLPVVDQTPVVVLSNAVNTIVSTTATLLTRPPGAKYLFLQAEIDTWRVQVGDTTATISAVAPASTTSDGSSSMPIAVGPPVILNGPDKATVKGPNAGSKLTYWWV